MLFLYLRGRGDAPAPATPAPRPPRLSPAPPALLSAALTSPFRPRCSRSRICDQKLQGAPLGDPQSFIGPGVFLSGLFPYTSAPLLCVTLSPRSLGYLSRSYQSGGENWRMGLFGPVKHSWGRRFCFLRVPLLAPTSGFVWRLVDTAPPLGSDSRVTCSSPARRHAFSSGVLTSRPLYDISRLVLWHTGFSVRLHASLRMSLRGCDWFFSSAAKFKALGRGLSWVMVTNTC